MFENIYYVINSNLRNKFSQRFLLGFIMLKNIFKSITLLGFMDESFKNKGFFSLECDFKRYLSRGTIFFEDG